MDSSHNLADALIKYSEYLENRRPEISRAYERIVRRLARSGAGAKSPTVGDTLPPFLLPDDLGQLVNLNDRLADGHLVVSMNRGHWCGYCRNELMALQSISGSLKDVGTNIVAITPERQAFAKRLKARCELEFPVLCDIDNAYALQLGLAIWYGEEIKLLFSEIGINLPEFQGNSGWIVPIPATYVVGKDRVIKYSFTNSDFRRRISPEDILNAARSI